MDVFEIILYKKENGRVPVEEFIDTLPVKMQAKLLTGIKLLKVNGNLLREPYTKPLRDGLFELRAKHGSDITRILYFFIVGKKIVLTNGFIKKAQKTPKNEIELAEKYRSDYLARLEKE